jgi:hypothetical protein
VTNATGLLAQPQGGVLRQRLYAYTDSHALVQCVLQYAVAQMHRIAIERAQKRAPHAVASRSRGSDLDHQDSINMAAAFTTLMNLDGAMMAQG